MWAFKFPYTNFHDLNLDWILDTIKSDEERITANELKIKLMGGDDPLNDLHPVGSIFISSGSTSPAELFGGEWEQIVGRFLLGAGGNHESGSTGGSDTHSHALNKSNAYAQILYTAGGKLYQYQTANASWTTNQSASINQSRNEESISVSGGSGVSGRTESTTAMPPYMAVYMWRRVN